MNSHPTIEMSPTLPVRLLLSLYLGVACPALAGVGTNEPGAILVFPKVTSTTTQETIIQISNAAGSSVALRCFYIDASRPPDEPADLWAVKDFQVRLTRQQPTVWVAGNGLPPLPPDRPADLYAGPIPPVSTGFVGELMCVVVNNGESPVSRNVLTGEATVIDKDTHATRKYQAVGIQGLAGNDGNNTLRLDDVEYSSCPRILILNHFFEGAPDPVLNSPIHSRLTFVPCSTDLEGSLPGTANLQFNVSNEFEQRFSASLALTCFADVALSEISQIIFDFAKQGSLVGQTRIRPIVDAHTSHGHGALGIAEEFRDNGTVGSALNLHFVDGALQPDLIVLPSPF